MVTTFSPPVRVKKKKKPVTTIVLGVVCAALLIAVGVVYSKLSKEKATTAKFTETIVLAAQTVGVETVTPEALADATNQQLALEAFTSAVNDKVNELTDTKAALATSEGAATRLQGEGETAAQQLAEARSELDRARSDVKAKADEVTAAKKAREDEIAALTATVAELEVKLASAEEMLSATASEATEPVETVEAVVAAPVVEEPAAETVEGAEAEPAPAVYTAQAAVIPEGSSVLFKTVRHDPDTDQLVFLTLDEKMITYSEVPDTIYESLMAAPLLDIYYRFQILDIFPSEPKDIDVIRSISGK